MQDKCDACGLIEEIALELELPGWELNEQGEEEYHPTKWNVCFPCAMLDNNVTIR